MSRRTNLTGIALLVIAELIVPATLVAQDSSHNYKMDTFLLTRKGWIGKLAKAITAHQPEVSPIRNDLTFEKFRGKQIRNIYVRQFDFGISLNDTSAKFKNNLVRLVNSLHHTTNERVIRNNLFFKKGDQLIPYLFADNERHLRDLPYIHDAKIVVTDATDSTVDIIVVTKDVLSLGGSFRMHNSQRMSVAVSEDNFAGLGHEILIGSLFDTKRNPKFGYGGEYTARNIKGSFIDWYGGHLNYNRSFNIGSRNETMTYTGFTRPLVNPYMKFTYAAEAAYHATDDVYKEDTLYITDHRYRYSLYDAWIGWNTGAFRIFHDDHNQDNRLRTLIGVRYLQQHFDEVPLKYEEQYNYMYADIKAVLSSVTIFRQDFYKTNYVYGFGRNEDIPEGADLSFTGGWTKKAGIERPYFGIDLQRYFFTSGGNYFNYTLKADGFLRRKKLEDVNMLFNLEFFSRLAKWGKRWKERNFITAGIAHQYKRVLNEPLLLQSDFGLREWRNDTLNTGVTRATFKAESVFFTPWNLINFRFAPFVFANLSYFVPDDKKISIQKFYSSIGGGIRTRNESWIFETMEFRAFFFPKRNFLGDLWRIEFNTGIRFKYIQKARKPSFVDVNRI